MSEHSDHDPTYSKLILDFLQFRGDKGETISEIEAEIERWGGRIYRDLLILVLRDLSDRGLIQRCVEEPQGDRAERYLYVYNNKENT